MKEKWNNLNSSCRTLIIVSIVLFVVTLGVVWLVGGILSIPGALFNIGLFKFLASLGKTLVNILCWGLFIIIELVAWCVYYTKQKTGGSKSDSDTVNTEKASKPNYNNTNNFGYNKNQSGSVVDVEYREVKEE